MPPKPFFLDLELRDLIDLFQTYHEPAFRARQLWHGIYRSLFTTPDQIPVFSPTLKEKIKDRFDFKHLVLKKSVVSYDGNTQKLAFSLPDNHVIESVLMHYRKRISLCISTQVGCQVGCSFCATGQMGFQRNLSPGEIIEQVLYAARQLKNENQRLTNIIIMGMGEPFLNYEATMHAIKTLNHADGLKLGARRFTISTVGIVPKIYKFADENSQANLAISLHSTDNAKRSSIIPINTKYPIQSIIDACKYYTQVTNRRVTFEWALIKGFNDHPDEAKSISRLIHGFPSHINIIPLNRTDGYQGSTISKESVIQFVGALEQAGVSVSIRSRRGIDVNAGCGQLASKF